MCCDDDDDVELLAECSRSLVVVSCSSSSIRMAETKGMAVSSSSSEMATTEATGTEVDDDDDDEEEKAPDGLCSWTTVARGGGACKTGSCESAASKGLELRVSSNGLWLTRRTAGDAEKDPANMDNSDRVKGRFVR